VPEGHDKRSSVACNGSFSKVIRNKVVGDIRTNETQIRTGGLSSKMCSSRRVSRQGTHILLEITAGKAVSAF